MLTIIANLVLMVLVVGAIQFTTTNRQASTEKLRGDGISACTDVARRHLLSRLKLYGPSSIFQLMDTKLIDDPDPQARTSMMTGHYGSADAQPTVVLVSPEQMGASDRQVRDVVNIAPAGGGFLGGQYYRVVVKCQEGSGRESEVEFLFRYGL
ncbi:hypothetical protein [Vitiosangium sp. GDMCC 1.1324]|uniref:hypothetical protein n=1 Tax=Vitiosangium sp. (strain GDMCC 1.1324) TaxID=2138576 RepID=UPI000D3AC6E9|nr:hypothetical protein [Vitiosangium sp. GDMCC 1.1324]PTL80274.1 hypothetical protein DAT35_30255 [Vitiosangium sp. GDMCC 1.1324]